MPRQALIAFCSTLLISVVLLGCSKVSNGRVPVEGLVTLKGEPVKVGSIALRPKNGGLTSGGNIQGGRFTIPAKTGPTIGQYSARVTIVSASGDKKARFGGKTIEVDMEILADKKEYEIELSDSKRP